MNVFSRVGAVVIVVVFMCVPLSAGAAEIINLFSSDITVQKDSSVTVVETIDYDFGAEERHGIFRFISASHPEEASVWYRNRYIDIQVIDVKKDRDAEPYVVTDENNAVNVKIGDPDATISGRHVYEITYKLLGALSYPKQLPPELYWNVNGNQWGVPMLRVEAVLRGEGLLADERSCYRGYNGEGASCAIRENDGTITFEATLLKPGEEMTIAHALKPNTVAVARAERTNSALVMFIIAPVWLFGLAIYVYRYRTAHKTHRTVIAEYEPYPGVLPMQMGVLKDASLDPKDITAGIVYLAEQGYLKIRKTERKVLFLFNVDDYEITLLKSSDASAGAFTHEVLALLFDAPFIAGKITSLSELKSNRSKQVENHTLIQNLEKAIIADLSKENFYQSPTSPITKFQWSMWGLAACSLVLLFVLPGSVTVILVVVMVLSGILVAFLSRRLTKKGYEALDKLKGFKLFLSVTEKDRLEFHNAPEKSPEQFVAFLPYAIAFGVEEKWAEVFKGITIPTPSWYDGGSVGAFSATNLTSSLGGFSSSLSASSGASASSGGGSAGGGGGGGGGGSW